jgi:hypothetical protein
VKKRKIMKALRKARAKGCTCMTIDSRAVCSACLASDILGQPAPRRRGGYALKIARAMTRILRAGPFVDALELFRTPLAYGEIDDDQIVAAVVHEMRGKDARAP